jgi:hypothetical protein
MALVNLAISEGNVPVNGTNLKSNSVRRDIVPSSEGIDEVKLFHENEGCDKPVNSPISEGSDPPIVL